VFTGVLPISAVTLSYLALGEPMRVSHLIGAACVIAGIILVARETEA
jgi:drug/metabolite transporter (DMT)-like permease